MRHLSLGERTLLTFSRCTLRKSGTAWVRLGGAGPGLRIYDSRRQALPFSLRYQHRRALRLGPFAFVIMPAVGRWP